MAYGRNFLFKSPQKGFYLEEVDQYRQVKKVLSCPHLFLHHFLLFSDHVVIGVYHQTPIPWDCAWPKPRSKQSQPRAKALKLYSGFSSFHTNLDTFHSGKHINRLHQIRFKVVYHKRGLIIFSSQSWKTASS